MKSLPLALVVFLSIACSSSARPVDPGVSMAASAEEPLPVDAEESEYESQIQDHLANARDYQANDDFGLALTELDQALALEPNHRAAQEAQRQLRAQAAAQVQQQLERIAVAARADAAAAAAVATQETQAAAAREATRVQATVTAYTRLPPRGDWGAQAGGVAVAIGSFQYHSQVRFQRAAPGARYVSFGILVQNRGQSAIHVNPGNVTLVDQDRVAYRYDSSTFSWCDFPLRAVDVRPGDKAEGCLVFYTNGSSGPAKIIYRTASIRGVDVVVDLERAPDL